MSDKSKNQGFQKMSWTSNSAGARPAVPAGGSSTNGFQNLSSPQQLQSALTQEFESPYVSEKKLKEINEAVRKTQAPPPPDVEAIKRQAYKEGFAKGEADGIKAGRQQAQAQVAQLQGILSELSQTWERLVAANEKQIVNLVCKVAEKVVCGLVAADDEVVKRSILNAFSAIPEPVDVSIEVNPTDYEYIETIKEDFFASITTLKDVSVSADPSVARGGCRILTRAGQVDGSVQARLEAVQKALTETIAHKKGINGP